jgi:hypothetical protein
MRAAVVELGPGRAGCADGADDLVAQLDHHAAAKEHDVRQLGEWCKLSNFGQGKRVVLERNASVRLVMRAIERVDTGAVAAQCHDRGAVGVEHRRGFVVTLLCAGRDRLARRFDGERRGNAMRRQRIRPSCRCTDQCTGRHDCHFAHVFHDLPPLTDISQMIPGWHKYAQFSGFPATQTRSVDGYQQSSQRTGEWSV